MKYFGTRQITFRRQCYPYMSSNIVISRNLQRVKGKYKVRTRTGHEDPKVEYRYTCISSLSLTFALEGVGD